MLAELQGDMEWIILTLLAAMVFVVAEGAGFKWPERFNTLSHAVYTLGSKWPLSIFLMGMFAGGLAVHFFWHWCPPGSISQGLLELPLTIRYMLS